MSSFNGNSILWNVILNKPSTFITNGGFWYLRVLCHDEFLSIFLCMAHSFGLETGINRKSP